MHRNRVYLVAVAALPIALAFIPFRDDRPGLTQAITAIQFDALNPAKDGVMPGAFYYVDIIDGGNPMLVCQPTPEFSASLLVPAKLPHWREADLGKKTGRLTYSADELAKGELSKSELDHVEYTFSDVAMYEFDDIKLRKTE